MSQTGPKSELICGKRVRSIRCRTSYPDHKYKGWVDNSFSLCSVRRKDSTAMMSSFISVRDKATHIKEMTTRQMADISHRISKVIMTNKTIIWQKGRQKVSPSLIEREGIYFFGGFWDVREERLLYEVRPVLSKYKTVLISAEPIVKRVKHSPICTINTWPHKWAKQ